MSYDVSLEDDQGKPVEVSRHQEGGTYVAGGTTDAELNVTYNYSNHFSVMEELDGKRAGDTLDTLRRAVAKLGTERDPDYWKSTPGNVGYMASILLGWAVQYPEAVWRVE